MYLLDTILTSTDPNIRQIAEHYDWYIFPVYNPDGYDYTHTTVSSLPFSKNKKKYFNLSG